MKITLYEDEVDKLEKAGLVTLDDEVEDRVIEFEKAEDAWKMTIYFTAVDDFLEVSYHACATLVVPEEMVEKYITAVGRVFER